MDKEEILAYFYETYTVEKEKKGWKVEFDAQKMKGVKFEYDLVDANTGKVVLEKDKKITPRKAKELVEKGLTHFLVKNNYMLGKYLAKAIVLSKTGEVLADAGDEITEELLAAIDDSKVKSFELLYIDNVNVGPYIRNTLMQDRNTNREEALGDIYKVMRPGEPVTLEASEAIFKNLFFDEERYD
jgi:DNA-directed RNA polymerase subunit beta